MASTSAFGWETPDDTDLVKDGAAAIRTLGNSIDTSMADLKGGTTGQILSKASNTDMDFTWVANDVGDITAVTAGTGITGGGTSGAVTVSFDQANFGGGQFAAGKNKVINGNFGIWQRGTSFSYVGGQQYTADRWFLGSGALGRTVSRQSSGLTGFQYCARVQRDSGNTSTSIIKLMQALETVNSIPVAGQTVNLSFYARAGANYSTASSALSVRLVSGTGIDQNFDVGYTGSTDVVLTNVTLTTSWQRFTVTGTVGSTATELGVQFQSTPVGTAGAADFFEVTGVQLEAGSVATPFQTASGSQQAELAMCQRYYQAPSLTPAALIIYSGSSSGGFSANAYSNYSFPVQMRVTPTLTFYAHDGSTGQVTLYVSTTAIKSTSVAGIGAQPFGWTGNFSGTGWGTNADSGLLAYGYKAEAEL